MVSVTPIATVGIPFLDEEHTLAAATRSILRQTVSEIEVLLVDDGSTDRSLEIARSFSDPRVVVLSDGTRRGLPARLNEITRRARAEVVVRMDADDVSHPTRLERQLACLEATASDAVGCWIALIDENEHVFAISEAPTTIRSAAEVLDWGVFPHASMVARRSWLLENPYNEMLTRAEDRELFCRTIRTSRFGVVPEVLYVVRVSARGGFLADYRTSHRQNRIIFRQYGPEVVGLGGTLRRIAVSYAKSAVMTTAARLGLADSIVRRRGRPARTSEVAIANEAICRAR
jgi:glycosyltransferase involved in cell wall biosynthesis